MRYVAIGFVFALIIVQACKHQVVNPNPPGTGNNNPPADVVCFETQILPIFQSSCAKSPCHDAGSANKGYVFDTYQNIIKKGIVAGNASESKVYKMIIETDPGDRMPKPPFPALLPAQIELIKRWINEGAKNTTGCNPCDDNVFTYSAAIKPIVEASCINCHSGSNPGGGFNFSTHSGLQQVALNGKLLTAITHTGTKPMPMGLPKLSDCKISQFQKWINAGAPNN